MPNSYIRKTKRLIVRPLRLEDYEPWKMAHASMPAPQNKWDLGGKQKPDLTRIKFQKLLRSEKVQRENDVFYSFGIFQKSGELVGMVSLMEVSRRVAQSAYLGYRIFNPYWARGYAKEAVLAAIDIAFTDLKLHRIEAGIEPENRRSIRLARALKLRKEGLKKRALFLRNQWVDLLIYSATTEDLGYKFKGIETIASFVKRNRT